jgi:hypothetical protein
LPSLRNETRKNSTCKFHTGIEGKRRRCAQGSNLVVTMSNPTSVTREGVAVSSFPICFTVPETGFALLCKKKTICQVQSRKKSFTSSITTTSSIVSRCVGLSYLCSTRHNFELAGANLMCTKSDRNLRKSRTLRAATKLVPSAP